MKINADIGEMTGNDAAVISKIELGNIACGCHASNPAHMEETVLLAIANHTAISAHPGYDDRENFGRTSIPYTADEIITLVDQQVTLLRNICQKHSTPLSAVKPHGALYHDMMHHAEIRQAISYVANQHQLPLIVQAQLLNDPLLPWDCPILREVFADRAYTEAGELVPRSQPGALIMDSDAIVAQAQQLINRQSVTTLNGSICRIPADTICFHGDHSPSVHALQSIQSIQSLDADN